MAILPNKGPLKLVEGPKPISIEEYRKMQARLKEQQLTAIPKVPIKNRRKRGGKLVKLGRELATLSAIINADPPPSWERAAEVWQKMYKLEAAMEQHKNK